MTSPAAEGEGRASSTTGSGGATTAAANLKLSPAWPTELRFQSAAGQLHIRYDDGYEAAIPYELLRVESPSAETKGHGANRPPPPPGKRGVGVTGAEPVGRYAVRIRFSDGHDTGLYSWGYLRELAEQAEARMASYVARMRKLGLPREGR
ncbi:MAG: gamma-butyrobetaine hydroxylase-like domain-containing protein [Alphaproteobacteria bacterium]|nr:gamma-butyrobetaine hydroxylase-like domain-containing protein [Alphaproteobacteria bacterium]